MTPEERARWEELREQAKKDQDVEETVEYSDLMSLRTAEIMRMIPIPQCCEASRKYPTVTFSVDYGDDLPSNETEGKWTIRRNDELEHYYRRGEDPRDPTNSWWANIPRPKFCPYCGKDLPKMRRKDPPPETVCLVTDGGYYCARCHERLNCCLCDPLGFAFEPVP